MIDVKTAEDMQTSLLWAGVVEELNRKIEFCKQKLVSCSPENLREIQIMIACCESLKRLPQDIIDRES